VKRSNEFRSCVELINCSHLDNNFMCTGELTSDYGISVSTYRVGVINFKAMMMECSATGPDCSNDWWVGPSDRTLGYIGKQSITQPRIYRLRGWHFGIVLAGLSWLMLFVILFRHPVACLSEPNGFNIVIQTPFQKNHYRFCSIFIMHVKYVLLRVI
jgi:hypothetical protein